MTTLPPASTGIDRSAPPRADAIRPFHFPHFLRTRLPNGLAVLAARHSELPLISMELLLPAGGQYDPEGQSGLASLTAAVLDEGTERRSAMEIATTAERLGGYFATAADWDVGFLATGLLAQNRTDALELLADVAFHPTFPTAEVERIRRQRLAEILRRMQDPASLADDRFLRVLYEGTSYAHPLIGEEASLAALDREALVGFYQRHYRLDSGLDGGLDGAILIAVGDFDPEALLREAESTFATGGPATPPAPPPEIHPPSRPGISVHIVDRPGAVQTELRMGHPGVSRNHPDYPSLVVFNGLLGGKFTSRINLNLRERHGYTYGASTRFSGRMGPGPFTVSAAVATESTGASAREILFELRRIREELVEPEELTETQSYLIGVFPYTMQTIGDLAKRLETLAIFGLPDDYYTRHLERIAGVTREDVLDVARRHLDPEHVAIVAVGPAEALEPQLQGLGPVTVWNPQGEPQPA